MPIGIKQAIHYSDSMRITIRLDSLEQPLREYCERSGITPSEAVRSAIAQFLEVDAPKLSVGNPTFGAQQAKKAGKSRRKKNSQNNS